jgi:hypothetical protein
MLLMNRQMNVKGKGRTQICTGHMNSRPVPEALQKHSAAASKSSGCSKYEQNTIVLQLTRPSRSQLGHQFAIPKPVA